MNIRYFILLTISLFCQIKIISQPKCHFEHYGTEDGLPQHTVMDILQDKRGFMWFSTWDGLCKFDGYNFHTYKIQQGDIYHMRSNRIDFIKEDKYGNIWTLPYDGEPHRFDPKTERFMGLRSLPEYEDFTFTATDIIPTSSGKVWLISERMGCVCVSDSTFNAELFNINNKRIQASQVYTVHEDNNKNTWLLTNNGLYNVSPDNKKINNIFSEKEYDNKKNQQDFYCAEELNDQIWFGSDEGRIWIYDKKDCQFELLKIETVFGIQAIKTINDTHIAIITNKDGFFLYNRLSKTIEKYNSSNLPEMKVNEIISCYIDKSENIWFEMNQLGVYKFNLNTRQIKHFTLKIESAISNVFPPNFFIFEDNTDRIWIHLRGGGFAYYNAINDELVPFYNEPNSPTWRFSNMMHAGFSDRQGNLWLSTRSHGLEKVIFNNDVFEPTIVDPNIHSTINNDIRAILEDKNKNLWVSTKGGKVFIYNSQKKQLGYICETGQIGTDKPLDGITYCILEDNAHNIWLGTKGEGVYKLIPTGNKLKYDIEHYKNLDEDLYSLSHNSVYSIFQDKEGRIWVGTYGGGINLFDDERKRFINHKNNLKNYPIQYGSQIRIISSDKYGNVCVGTTLGLIIFSSGFALPGSIDYKSYIRIPGDNESISANDIYDICTTSHGETYIATFGGGINKINTVDDKGFPQSFMSYTIKDGLPSNVILTLVEDNQNNIWITTEGNITRFSPATNSFETYSEVNRLIQGQNFSENARSTSLDGTVYFGYSKGFLSVNPEKIKKNNFKPYIALTRLQIANKDVPISDNSPLTQNLDYLKFIKLNHKQNFINIEFAALDFIETKKISYAYQLEGFDEDWITIQKQRVANYTNLSPGKYIFRVKSTNSDGIWMDNEHLLHIEITPSFWQTGLAYTLYFILAISILFIILRTIFIFYRLKYRVRMEKEETEMKTRFFTDISHEIRTPLTMIVSPIENIIEDEKTPAGIKNQLHLVLKNANRMLRMVNQILDFRKIQKQKLNLQEINIGEYISEICNNFSKTAEAKNINLSIHNMAQNVKIWIDADSIEKLIFNLLSNAIKYTPNEKSIEVHIKYLKKDNQVSLEVKDEGRGMSKDVQNKLFTRFASFNKDKSKPSTGIGLSIVKEVADKHHAKILVNSEVNAGSTFIVMFSLGLDHFKGDTNVAYLYEAEKRLEDNTKEKISVEEIAASNTIVTQSNQQFTILIAEDDNDLRSFITTILMPHYEILEAINGKDGYEAALKKQPDFILSDLMMPEMDGIEFLQKIKANSETSHIPFILLTAKTDIESKVSGLSYGADDYLTKPFSVKYLKARIENILNQRKSLYTSYIKDKGSINNILSPEKEKSSQNYITPQDELFLNKIREEIERNIDNSNFLVEDLVSSMAMSRTVFFKKLKSLTGLAPVEFIRDIKIKHAAGLLETQRYSVKEVSFMVGISDTKYFTQCFKKAYNMTPSEYKTHRSSL